MAYVDLGSGVLYDASEVGAGTGNYNSFLRLQAGGDEDGFNTDDNNVADNKNGIWTHSVDISGLEIVVIDSVEYYEIRLDLNEDDSGDGPNITLEELRMFHSTAPADEGDYLNDFVDLNEFFNLSGSLALLDINSGSGTDDYHFLIPADLLPATGYFTLYSEFSGTDGGFEEWRVRSSEVGDGLPLITLVKDASPTVVDEDTPTAVTYTYTLTSQSVVEDELTLTSFIDDNGTPGDTSDDIDLLEGAGPDSLGIYYISGDLDFDERLDSTETWVFEYTRAGVLLNADEELENIAAVTAIDEEGNNTSDDDDAVVTGQDVLPAIAIDKVASVTSIQAGDPTLVTFSYTITNESSSPLDPLLLTSLVDDNGTSGIGEEGDDIDLLAGIDATYPLGIYYVSGDADGDELLDTNESWLFEYSTTLTLAPGETRTNIVAVEAEDDEGNPVSDTDDASVMAYNLGRTPGFWSNNGSRLWDGDGSTMPKAGGLGIVAPGDDLMYLIEDLNLNGVDDVPGINGANGYLLIGDWNTNGIADADENVLLISRADAMSFLNASEKLQKDGRFMLARDVVASWLNFLGGSYVGDSDDEGSAMHYVDEAVAWLIETTDGDHFLTRNELLLGGWVATNDDEWKYGFDFDEDMIVGENVAPATGHDIGDAFDIDVMAGALIHAGLDHYNNYGFI